HIEKSSEPARFDERGDIREGPRLATHCPGFPEQKWTMPGLSWRSMAGIAQRCAAKSFRRAQGLFGARDRRAAAAGLGRGRRLRCAVDHAAEAGKARLGDFAEHEIV